MTDLIIIMVGSFHMSTYISSVMHLNQGMGQWLIFVLLLKVKLLTVALSWKSLDLPKSVPRLELNAAVINSSILLFTKLTCQLKKTIFWSGSMLTLQYIQDKSHCNHTCKHIQRGELSEEYSQLTKDGAISKKSKPVQLCPYLDNYDIVRVGGCIDGTAIPNLVRHQIILPGKHYLVNLLIKSFHDKTHNGTEYILAELKCTG